MKKKNQKKLCITTIAMLLFLAWTIAITKVDLQAVGPENSVVGFASWNTLFHKWTGVHMWLYNLTDWLGLVPVGFVFGFGILGLFQLVKRKSLFKVDLDIIILGVFYICVMGAYLLFEMFAINYRPILIEGRLEASYPSSTTLLVLCIMPTAMMQLHNRMRDSILKKIVIFSIAVFMIFMVVGRLISGVHWFTDIIGGILLSISLLMMYCFAISLTTKVDTEGRKCGI